VELAVRLGQIEQGIFSLTRAAEAWVEAQAFRNAAVVRRQLAEVWLTLDDLERADAELNLAYRLNPSVSTDESECAKSMLQDMLRRRPNTWNPSQP